MDDIKYKGLTSAEVLESRAKYGRNVLTPARKESWLRQFLCKFKDPLIIILLVAGVLSIAISFYEYIGLDKGKVVFFEPVGIFIAIMLATGLSFLFEKQAEREFAVLNQVNDEEPVIVMRDGNVTEVPRRDVVVGDIVMLSAGQEIPADAKLIEAVELKVDESTLTGEPICSKTTDPDKFKSEATYPSDMVYRGTKVVEGHGVARVMDVGDATENGKVFESVKIDDSVRTPLNEQLDRIGALVAKASYLVASLVIIGRILMYVLETGGNADWIEFLAYFLQTVMLAVTLIVVAVPEGLPMAVTLSLAYSMRRMLKTHNLVRKLHACETMGATTVICTDKTGTLTRNQMQVETADFPCEGDACRRRIASCMAVNSTAQLDMSNPDAPKVVGNPTEGALLLWLAANGYDYRTLRNEVKRIAEIPFSTDLKYMASDVVMPDGDRLLIVKGAPEIVMSMCKSAEGDASFDDVRKRLAEYQSKAMRTLAFAYKPLAVDDRPASVSDGAPSDLIFQGLVAILDPVRDDVPDAIAECIHAGVKVKIVTGDTSATAREIGRRIGLWTDSDTDSNIITGSEIEAMTDDDLKQRVQSIKIVARARPMDKKRLVMALKSNDEVVAVTGDGTNDAPALKSADVGLSMGDGTSVAKEASDITIIDNSFTSISRAVMWGRSLYRNIQRFVLFQMTVNVAACLVVLAGAFMGTAVPLTVTQMLWVNLVMDTFAAMALASLPPSASVMNERPRDRHAFMLSGAMRFSILGVGLLFAVIMCAMLWVLEHSSVSSVTDLFHPVLGKYKGLSDYEVSLFFTIFVMLQFWNMFNARAYATRNSAFRLHKCGEFIFISTIILVGQILIVTFGGELLNVTPLSLSDWIWIVVLTSPVLLIGEVIRAFKRIKG